MKNKNVFFYLKVGDASVRDDDAAAEEEASGDVAGVDERGDEGHGAHLPVVTQRGGAQQQPTVERRQIAEREEPATENSRIRQIANT